MKRTTSTIKLFEELALTDGEKCYRVDLRSQVEHLLSLEEIS